MGDTSLRTPVTVRVRMSVPGAASAIHAGPSLMPRVVRSWKLLVGDRQCPPSYERRAELRPVWDVYRLTDGAGPA
jgi:hypothetical protein